MAAHTAYTENRRGGKKLWIIILAAAAVLLAGILLWLSRTYVYAGGFFRRDSAQIDLRGRSISEKKYLSLREKLPDCEIYWDVPIGGASADCESESLVLSAFTQEDMDSLTYFPKLTVLDLTAADVSPEFFDALHAAYPALSVRWSIPIGASRYPSDAERVTLTDFDVSELSRFAYFTALRSADARDCTCYDAILVLHETYPALELSWQVPLSGTEYLQDAVEIAVDDSTITPDGLRGALRYLPSVQTVSYLTCSWSTEEKNALSAEFPSVMFIWPVEILDVTYPSDTTELSFAGRTLSESELSEIAERISALPQLTRVDLTDTGVTPEIMTPVCEKHPDVDFVFTFELYGLAISTEDTLLDFTGIEMESTDAVEAILPVMHKLEKVDMSDCGFSDEEMDALNKKYENVRFVWTMHISYYDVRTDATGFRATEKHYGYLDAEALARFKYCEDMVAIDIGHRRVPTVDFLYDMPQVKYLVLQRAECWDITAIGTLEDLEFLELHRAYVNSITPLINCKNLKYLNLVYLMGNVPYQEIFDTLMQMDSLEMVWLDANQLTDEQLEQLRRKNPDCLYHEVPDWDHSVEDPWRYSEGYYAMRDALGMAYMNGEGSWVDYKVVDGEKVPLDPEFLANQSRLITDMTRG